MPKSDVRLGLLRKRLQTLKKQAKIGDTEIATAMNELAPSVTAYQQKVSDFYSGEMKRPGVGIELTPRICNTFHAGAFHVEHTAWANQTDRGADASPPAVGLQQPSAFFRRRPRDASDADKLTETPAWQTGVACARMTNMAAIQLIDPAPEPIRWSDIEAGRTVMGYMITEARTEFYPRHPTRPEQSQKPCLKVTIEAESIDKTMAGRIHQSLWLIAEGFEVILTVNEKQRRTMTSALTERQAHSWE